MRRLFPGLLMLLAALAATPALSQVEFVNNEPVPPLTLADGRDLVTVAAGRPIVVLFWASWCPYCKALMPHLQSMLDEYTPDRLEVLAISFREDEPEDAQKMLDAQGYDFVTELDGDQLADSWGATATPRVYLVGADGRLLYDLQADQSEPNRRYLTAPSSHAGKAARIAPHWAAQLRNAIDRSLAAQAEAKASASEPTPVSDDDAPAAEGGIEGAPGDTALSEGAATVPRA
jgi:thiol-disulfide isomerase/thioredoxin